MTLGSTQTLTEISTRNISQGPIIMKPGSLNPLKLSRSVQACTGTALPGDYQTVRRGAPGCGGIFQNVDFFLSNDHKLLVQIVIELFGPNYLITESIGYFFWPRGIVKKYC